MSWSTTAYTTAAELEWLRGLVASGKGAALRGYLAAERDWGGIDRKRVRAFARRGLRKVLVRGKTEAK